MCEPPKPMTRVEITPEMVNAGGRRLFDMFGAYDQQGYSRQEVAEFVFRAMLAHFSAICLS